MTIRLNSPSLFHGMNKTEMAYATILEAMRRNGDVRLWRYERVTLKLADDTRYTPDFFVVLNDGSVEFIETKGAFIREDAAVKLKVAATAFPEFTFRLAQQKQGRFTVTEVKRAA